MKWIGLTGGIASGKTTVAELLRKSGYPVVDADLISREVTRRGTPAFKKIVEVFGRTFVQDSDGELDRRALGALVFDNLEKRLELERIVHPQVQKRVNELRAELESKGHKTAFYDVPLLFEKNLEGQFDSTVVVACSAPTQLNRLMARNKLKKNEAAARIATQIPMIDKAAMADYVIWNDGAMEDLNFEFQEFLKKIREETKK